MKTRKVFIRRIQSNELVTFNNSNILKRAAENLGIEVVDTNSIDDCLKYGAKDDIYIVTVLSDVRKLYQRGRELICCWYQGLIPEESYMRHNSLLRYKVLSLLEKYALRHCKLNFVVSEAMKDYYSKKYKLDREDRYYVLPCFNTTLHESAFFYNEKYKNNTFVYAGGLDVWQCFEKTLKVYKTIECFNIPNTKLVVMTKNQDFAFNMINAAGIKNYEIGYTTPEDLPNILAKGKFGFVLRDDTAVNRVSTPTKLSTYLSCGIIPIYSECISAFDFMAKKMEYVIPWKENNDSLNKIKTLMSQELSASKVLEEYRKVFDTYYSNEFHVDNITALLKTL